MSPDARPLSAADLVNVRSSESMHGAMHGQVDLMGFTQVADGGCLVEGKCLSRDIAQSRAGQGPSVIAEARQSAVEGCIP